jgi:hypothetical protein
MIIRLEGLQRQSDPLEARYPHLLKTPFHDSLQMNYAGSPKSELGATLRQFSLSTRWMFLIFAQANPFVNT